LCLRSAIQNHIIVIQSYLLSLLVCLDTVISAQSGNKEVSGCPNPTKLSFHLLSLVLPFPSPFLSLPLPIEVGPLNTARGLGSTVSALAESRTDPQWKLNFVHFYMILTLKSDIWWHRFY